MMPNFDEILREAVRKFLVERFDSEELCTICFDPGVPYDNLPAEGIAAKMCELTG